jgi:diguanylate cyclase (GGDEF)-like protein/PAS domain S-box-containing protein
MKLSKLVEIDKLHRLVASFQDMLDVPCSLLDAENTLAAVRSRNDICAKHHATNSNKACLARWESIAKRLAKGEAVTSSCPLGLHDIALPVMIDDHHAGSIFIGPFRTDEPDRTKLGKLAAKLHLDADELYAEHLAATLIQPEKISSLQNFMIDLAGVITTIGQDNNRLAEAEKELRDASNELEQTVAARTQELEETKIRLNDAQHIGKIGNFQIDLMTDRHWWSDELYRLLGYDPGSVECTIDNILARLQPEDRRALKSLIEKSIENCSSFHTELRGFRPSGKRPWFFAQFFVDCNEQGQAIQVRGALRNISFRKKIEQELRHVNRLQQRILDNTHMGIALIRDRRFIWMNQKAADISKHPVDELINQSTRILYIDDQQYATMGQASKAAFESGQQYDAVHHFKRSDGSRFWCRTIAAPLDWDDLSQGGVWIIEDVTERLQAERELMRSRHELQSIFDNTQVGMLMLQNDRQIIRTNERLAEILGYPSPESMNGLNVREIHLSENAFREFGENFYYPLRESKQTQVEFRLRRKDGSAVWCMLSGKALDTATQPDLTKGVIWAIEDISQRKRTEKALRSSERRFRAIFANAGVGICTLDRDGTIQRVNSRMAMLVGYSDYDLMGMNISEITHEKDQNTDKDLNSRLWIRDIPMYVREKRYVRLDGSEVWGRVTTTIVRDDEGNPKYILQVIENINELKRLEAKLVRMAKTDALTEVNNRFAFLEQSEHEFKRFKRYGTPYSVLMLDVDHFKSINDTHGHQAGDCVLRELAKTCTTILRDTDIFGRIGGEEFAAVLVETPLENAYSVAERMRLAIEDLALPWEDAEIRFTASIGVTELRPEDQKLETAQHRADALMYEAKAQGRNRVIKG